MDGSTEIPLCENEPIHIPGSVQPHGLMLLAARHGLLIWQVAGDVETLLGATDWLGAPLAALIGAELTARLVEFVEANAHDAPAATVVYLGQLRTVSGLLMDASAHLAGLAGTPPDARDTVMVELEPANTEITGPAVLNRLEEAAASFARADGLNSLCQVAAAAFRRLTGFDRVLIYRFGDDGAGRVLAEDKRTDMRSFLNHYFPASDIPRQARALYVRNLVRVIPDIHYTPAPLRPPAPGAPIDMSDASLRSVSPIHLQYMFNMGMRASASFSIVKDDALWGLVACHHQQNRRIPYELRAAGRVMAATLAREIQSKEDAAQYHERAQLREFQDDIVRRPMRDGAIEDMLPAQLDDIRHVMQADGVAVLHHATLVRGGICPAETEIQALADWVLAQGAEPVRATDRLSTVFGRAAGYSTIGSGLLALVIDANDPWLVLWFRAEQVQTMRWAGNPHHDEARDPAERLNPRVSFDDWIETVRGRARPWSNPELEAADRLRTALLELRQNRRTLALSQRLTSLLGEQDVLLQQKEFLLGEVNHRVQNSLQLVSTFLGLQSRDAADLALRGALDEARRRLLAVGLVHRRLYNNEQVQQVDAARYIEELCADTLDTLGQDWRPHVSLDLAPVMISTDRAVAMGLVLTELIININKYAYAGQSGPIEIALAEQPSQFQLVVADRGVGKHTPSQGFGTRMMHVLVAQLHGELAFCDNAPGLRAVLTAPL